MAHGEDFDPRNYRRYELINKIFHYGIRDAEFDSLSTDEARIADDRVERIGPQTRLYAGLRESLVGYWPLNNLSDGLNDRVNDNDITTTGGPSVTTGGGAFGDGVLFGEGAYGTIPNDGTLAVSGSGFTVSFYLRVPALNDKAAVPIFKRPKTQADTSASFFVSVAGSGNTWLGSNRGDIISGYGYGGGLHSVADTGLGEGPLYHVCMTYDPQNNRLTTLLNGKAFSTQDFSNAPNTTDSNIYLGVKFDSTGSPDTNFDENVILSDLRIYDRKIPIAETKTLSRLPYPESSTFRTERLGTLFAGSVAGPCLRYDESKTDPYRLLLKDYDQADNPVELYTASSFSTDLSDWTNAASDIISAYGTAGATEPSDFVYDGSTYYVYMSDGSDETEHVFTGSDWTSLTHDSEVLSNDRDSGSFRLGDGTTLLYAEDSDNAVGFGSNKLAIHRAPSPNGTFSQVGFVDDLTDVPWHTGDPCINKIDGSYWLFTDNTETHPHYDTAVFRSENLYEWELIDEALKGKKGGDFEVAESPDGLIAATEISGPDARGIDLWRLYGPQ